MKLDNTGGRPDPLGTHFLFTVDKRRIVYCRIRKNGCSAMNRFIVATSPMRGTEGPRGFAFLRRHHAVANRKQLMAAHHRMVIVREPVERLRSLYVNKFVQRRGFQDIFDSYRRVTGQDPETATFPAFVLDYVARLGEIPLDPHVWPQAWHLCNVTYDRVLLLRNLKDEMVEIVGPKRAEQFFQQNVNASPPAEVEIPEEIRARALEIYAEDVRMMARVA